MSAVVRAGTAAAPPYETVITPESAGWGFCGLRVLALDGAHALRDGRRRGHRPAARGRSRGHGRRSGLHPRRAHRGLRRRQRLRLRPAGRRRRLEGGGRFALASARAATPPRAAHVAAADVPVELRGAGNASRQVNNFCAPEAFAADRLIAVEVLTPDGNWSSYPPHKHDEERAGEETALEEIYYFEVGGGGFGYQRVYGSGPGREIDVTAEIRIGRRDRHAARLPRAVDGGARLPAVLPQRDGRPG